MYRSALLLGAFLGGSVSIAAAVFFVQVPWVWLGVGIVLGIAGFVGVAEAYFQMSDPAYSRLAFMKRRMDQEAQQMKREKRANQLHNAKRRWPNVSEVELSAQELLWDMHWRDFEQLVARYYEEQGFLTTWVGKSGDHGADILVTKNQEPCVIQCKNYAPNSMVSPNELRSLVGAMAHYGASSGVILTSNVISPTAREYANGKNFEVIEGQALVRLLLQAGLCNPQEQVTERD